ncbi:MAG: chloride channel protein [Caldilineaceae bacterium]|nr:chloride channel protein [Caldilineaceae bacterium]
MLERLKRISPAALPSYLVAWPAQFDRREQHLVVISMAIGVVVWAAVYSLKVAVHWSSELVMEWVYSMPSPLLILVPILAGAVLTTAIALWRASHVYYRDKDNHLHALNDVEGDGLERTIGLYYTSEPALDRTLLGVEGVRARWELPTFSLALRKFAGTLLTLASGGSGGLEASVTLIGESLAVGLLKPRRRLMLHNIWVLRFWRWWRTLNPDELQTAQLGGVAAAISTLLGAPLAGAFFATEVMYRRRPVIEKLIFALVASLTAFFLSHFTTMGHTRFVTVFGLAPPPFTWHYYLAIAVMALFVVFVDIYLRRVRTGMSRFFHRYFPNTWYRHLAGAALTAFIGLAASWLTGERLDLVLGTGERGLQAALAGELTIWVAAVALVGKLLATMATITSGGSAGMLVPSLFLGGMAGVIVAQLFDYAPAMLVIPSITASLVSLINVPLTAIMLTVEIFGASYLLPALVVLLITLLLSHPTSVYRTQREEDESREILPGYGVRRISVPAAWEGKTLRDLALRVRYDVNCIGYVETRGQSAQITPYVPAIRPLRTGDRLIIMGKNSALTALLAEIDANSELPLPGEETASERVAVAGHTP